MSFLELQHFVRCDLFRYDRASGCKGFLRTLIIEAGFRHTFLLRLCRHLKSRRWSRWGSYHLAKFWLNRLSLKLGIHVDITTELGPGLYLAHPSGIIINRRCRIGANCNISHHVTLGHKSRGPKKGCPVLGDRVYIGPGAVVIGAIQVGNDVAIGANAVITKDVPDGAVAAGIPAKVISMRGSVGYINDCLP